MAIQNQPFKPGNSTSPSAIAFTEMYAYTQPGQVSGKRLQVLETISGILHARDLDTAYMYDKEGAMTKVTYPNSGPAYTYSFDSMHRPTGLTDQNNNTDVSGVSYNAASQLLGMTYFGASETRQYNNLAQLTQLTVTGSASLSYAYNFPAGANNGKISSQVVSGETITYQYDSLSRLISAQSSASWGETYGYDAFGNLVAKTPTAGSPPTLSVAANPANNQIVGQSYDANGNQTSAPAGGSLTYDSENRLLTAPGVQFAYDSHSQRVWAGTLDGNGNLTGQQAFVYGVNGQMLGEYSVTAGSNSLTIATTVLTNYFGSKRIGTTNASGVSTALGSDRLDSAGQYYPYGEGKSGNNPADTWSFATYWRDSSTGLDYANARYYANQFGRFMTVDPDWKSGRLYDPGSWNRYAYARADPVNRGDPSGQGDCPANTCVTVTGVYDALDYQSISVPTNGNGGYFGSVISGAIRAAKQLANPYAAHLTPLIAPGTTQNQRQALDAGIDSAWAHIVSHPDCASFLTGNSGAGYTARLTQLANKLSNTNYLFGPLPGTVAATTNAIGGNQVTINTSGVFFTSPAGNGTASTIGYTSQGQSTFFTFNSVSTLDASILLHELGHETGVLPADGDNATNGSNNAEILNNCFTKNAQGVYQ